MSIAANLQHTITNVVWPSMLTSNCQNPLAPYGIENSENHFLIMVHGSSLQNTKWIRNARRLAYIFLSQESRCGKANPVGQWGCSTKSYKKPKNTKLIIKKVYKDNRKRGKRYYRKARSAETCKCFFCNKEGRHVLKSLKSLKGNFYRLIEKV